MKGVKFANSNRELGRPIGTKEEDCYGLPIKDVIIKVPSGEEWPGMRSVWQLTDEERKFIAEGADIVLQVCGTQHPPVALWVEKVDPEKGIME